MKSVKINFIVLLMILSIESHAFLGALALLGPSITSSIMNARTASSSERSAGLLETAGEKLDAINVSLQEAPQAEIFEAIVESIGGTKLDGSRIASVDFTTDPPSIVRRLITPNLTTQFTELLSYVDGSSDALSITDVDPTSIENFLTTLDFTNIDNLNLSKEQEIATYTKEVLEHLLGANASTYQTELNARYTAYADNIRRTHTLKGSIDLANLLKLEELIANLQQQRQQEVVYIAKLIDQLNRLQSKLSSKQSIGKIKSFEIK